jgi:DNA-binding GntR family transcriptional regulator
MGNLIGVGLLVSYRITQDPFEVFLSHHEDVLHAIEKRRPAVARKAMDRLLTVRWAEHRRLFERLTAC